MMKRSIFYFTALLSLLGCSAEFLEERPNSNIIVPSSPDDFQRLLDNFTAVGYTSALPHLSADEYFITSESDWLSSRSATERNAYVWERDVFGGEVAREDWNAPYRTVFYANSIIDGVQKQTGGLIQGGQYAEVYGQAHFHRARANYDLLKNFSVPFDSLTQSSDLGIPLRRDPSVDALMPRASVQECYASVFADLQQALAHLKSYGPLPERNRPTRLAVFAQLSRIYLNRGEFHPAERYADSVLNRYDRLIDYNSVSTETNTPFSLTNDELIMYGATNSYNNASQLNQGGTVFVDTALMALYDTGDLRRSVFFREVLPGRHIVKRGYNGSGLSPFNGLAVDEVLLIKAECLVRRGDLHGAEVLYNRLRKHRYSLGSYGGTTFLDAASALELVMLERRKELVWRGIRWDDIKRLNGRGAGIVLRRTLGGKVHTLEPTSGRYVFNIPQDEINRSGIAQNER